MKTYQSYKPSGIEWIGEIPENWDLIKLKYISNLYNGSSLNDNQKELFESSNMDDIPYVSTKDIDFNSQKIDYDNGLRIPKSNTSFKLGKKGSFLLCIEGGSSGKKMGFLEQDVYFVNKLCCFEPKTNSKFQFYYIQTPIFQSQFNSSLSGLIGGVSISLIKNFNSILPPLQEQEQIVNFLDEKTSIIDKLISTKKRKIELLKEQRSSLINEVITKGLDPNVKMTDSGVEWIGEIPEGWSISKFKYVSEIYGRIGYRGYTIQDIVSEDEGVITISPSNIKNDFFTIEGDNTYISYEKYYQSPEIMIRSKDIILVKTGSTIGKTSIIPENTPEMTINPQLVVVKNIKIHNKFLYYQTTCDFIKKSFYVEQTGSSTPTISQEKINNFPILKTSFQEQQQIVDYLDKHTREIDDLVQLEQNKIELLKEYRQSLISEVITGKIKVV
jgi:type I restriction enzyme S subunit